MEKAGKDGKESAVKGRKGKAKEGNGREGMEGGEERRRDKEKRRILKGIGIRRKKRGIVREW